MSLNVVGGDTAIESALDDLRDLIETSDKIPAAKKSKLLDLWDDSDGSVQWNIEVVPGAVTTLTGVEGGTSPPGPSGGPGTIFISNAVALPANLLSESARQRLRAVLLHELVHATGEKELDAEVFEHLLFGGRGATPPGPEDTGVVVDGKLVTGPKGFTELPPPPVVGPPKPLPDPDEPVKGDHFIWDPETGRVWRKGPDGKPEGPPVIDPTAGDPGGWRRRRAELQPNGDYFINGLRFDPVRLRLTEVAGAGTDEREVPVSPHFLGALFFAVNEYERLLMEERGGRLELDRLPLPLLGQVDLGMLDPVASGSEPTGEDTRPGCIPGLLHFWKR